MPSLFMGHPINSFNFIQLFVSTPRFLLSTVFTTIVSSLHQARLYPSLRLQSSPPLPGKFNPSCLVCQNSDEVILPSLIFCSLLFLYHLKCLHKIIIHIYTYIYICSVQSSHLVMSDSLQPHELQHARTPCPSPTPGVHSNSRPSSR